MRRVFLFWGCGAVQICVSAAVLTVLWNWHAVALGAPRLTVPRAVGVDCVFSVLNGLRGVSDESLAKKTDDEDETRALRRTSYFCFVMIAFLGIGWVAQRLSL